MARDWQRQVFGLAEFTCPLFDSCTVVAESPEVMTLSLAVYGGLIRRVTSRNG